MAKLQIIEISKHEPICEVFPNYFNLFRSLPYEKKEVQDWVLRKKKRRIEFILDKICSRYLVKFGSFSVELTIPIEG